MFEKEKVDSLLGERQPFHPLPGDLYSSPEVYRADLECIFHREWIVAGHTFELDKPGSYLSLPIGWYPIVVMRGKDGQILTVRKVCRHQGAKICRETRGRASRLVYLYHQWAYGLDGSLQFARFMGDDLDKVALGVKLVHRETVNSYIFVCLADEPKDLGLFRRGAELYLALRDMKNVEVARETNIAEHGDSKLVFENKRECYHCKANYHQLMRSFVENRTVAGINTSYTDNNVSAHWARREKAGFRSRLSMDPSGQFRPIRIPLAEWTFSYTMSGMPAVGDWLGQAVRPDLGVLLMLYHPSIWTHTRAAHAMSLRVLPVGPSETLLTAKWVVNNEAKEWPDYDIDNFINVCTQTDEDDRQIVERAAEGVSAPEFEPGPFSPEAEARPNQLVDWYCSFVRARAESTVLG